MSFAPLCVAVFHVGVFFFFQFCSLSILSCSSRPDGHVFLRYKWAPSHRLPSGNSCCQNSSQSHPFSTSRCVQAQQQRADPARQREQRDVHLLWRHVRDNGHVWVAMHDPSTSVFYWIHVNFPSLFLNITTHVLHSLSPSTFFFILCCTSPSQLRISHNLRQKLMMKLRSS